MAKRGKTYNKALENIDKLKLYEAEEAMKLAVDTARAKFDETVEVHVRLGVDGRHADQQVRGALVLPNGTGKTARVLVFSYLYYKSQQRQKPNNNLRERRPS